MLNTEHGYSKYTHGCRCGVCRKAKADYIRARRAAGVEPPRSREFPRPAWNQTAPTGRGAQGKRAGISRVLLPNVTHGRKDSYRRGCRCWPCTDAKRAADIQRQARKAATTARSSVEEPAVTGDGR